MIWEGFLCKITYMLERFPLPEICHLIFSLGLPSTTLLPPSSPPPVQERRQSPLAELQLNIKSWCANGDGVELESWHWRTEEMEPPPSSCQVFANYWGLLPPHKITRPWLGTHSHLDPKLVSDLGGKLLGSVSPPCLRVSSTVIRGFFKWMLLARVIHPYCKPGNVLVQFVVPWACGFAGEVLQELQEKASLWGVNSSREHTAPPGKNERQARVQIKWI